MSGAVAALLAQAAAELVMPRWRRLREGDVQEKSPGELVTVVDREVEAMLMPALLALRPGSRVVGEEACAARPELLQGLGEGEVWLVDPIDGTRNFAAGEAEFAIMVALLCGGATVASWMLHPATGTLFQAEPGAGAWRDGRRVRVPPRAPGQGLRGIVKTGFLPPGRKPAILRAAQAVLAESQDHRRPAGFDYPEVAAGRSDLVLYWRTLPWDHAPGALFLEEAGGHVARLDGTRYRPTSLGEGLLAAADLDCFTQFRTAV